MFVHFNIYFTLNYTFIYGLYMKIYKLCLSSCNYNQPSVLQFPAMIIKQVITCNAIQKVLIAKARRTSDCVIGRNAGLSSSVSPIGIPIVLAHIRINFLCPLILNSLASVQYFEHFLLYNYLI